LHVKRKQKTSKKAAAGVTSKTLTYFDLDELRSGDQGYARRALDPHLAVGVKTGDPRATSASAEERPERVCVSLCIARPVFDACVYDVEFEGEDVLEDVCPRCGGRDAAGRAREVGRFG
jgi:hypothetical protein